MYCSTLDIEIPSTFERFLYETSRRHSTHTCTCTHAYTHLRTDTHTYMHVQTGTHTYTHVHTCWSPLACQVVKSFVSCTVLADCFNYVHGPVATPRSYIPCRPTEFATKSFQRHLPPLVDLERHSYFADSLPYLKYPCIFGQVKKRGSTAC